MGLTITNMNNFLILRFYFLNNSVFRVILYKISESTLLYSNSRILLMFCVLVLGINYNCFQCLIRVQRSSENVFEFIFILRINLNNNLSYFKRNSHLSKQRKSVTEEFLAWLYYFSADWFCVRIPIFVWIFHRDTYHPRLKFIIYNVLNHSVWMVQELVFFLSLQRMNGCVYLMMWVGISDYVKFK